MPILASPPASFPSRALSFGSGLICCVFDTLQTVLPSLPTILLVRHDEYTFTSNPSAWRIMKLIVVIRSGKETAQLPNSLVNPGIHHRHRSRGCGYRIPRSISHRSTSVRGCKLTEPTGAVVADLAAMGVRHDLIRRVWAAKLESTPLSEARIDPPERSSNRPP
ncbi:hypothetical protein F5Y18DRAFT_100660 [Xylariaceae sp. FL1019]|nr:hypothetical protein F5Y18DRAFT_100660 [Xylariaceae sp. FL1019]